MSTTAFDNPLAAISGGETTTDIMQPDAPRIGGITPYLRLAALADQAGLQVAPHLAMETAEIGQR